VGAIKSDKLEGWGGRRDSNPQQQAPQAWTLPLSYDHQPANILDFPRACVKFGRDKSTRLQTATTAIQYVSPNYALNFSASFSPAAKFVVSAKVVEPLPDISVAAAPFSRKNSWNSVSNGYFSSAGASNEL
jgi:hypothetical protein